VGKVAVGDGAPVSVQTMTNTQTTDIKATVEQINLCEMAGCDIIRVAVPDSPSAKALKEIKRNIRIPLIADIQFHYRLALEAIENGCDGLRINPGYIASREKVREIARAAGDAGIPIRIGVNAGSLPRRISEKHKSATAEALVETALEAAWKLEDEGFSAIKLSLKASDVIRTVDAYRLAAARCDYPLHLGITEAGYGLSGTIRSAVGIGLLLSEGIGDTLRVSLTGSPVEEVKAGLEILRSLELAPEGIRIISCPTCARCQIDVLSLATEVEKRLAHLPGPLTVAVMGCVVNGPGEAREADYGITGGEEVGLVFRRGQVVARVKESELLDALVKVIKDDMYR